MSEEKKLKSNNEAVADYHKKLVNLATIRVPSPEASGDDYKDIIQKYLQKERNNISMNQYILELIEEDMNAHGYDIKIAKGVKQTR